MVSAVNFAAVFPGCRAVVHRGAGTTGYRPARRGPHLSPFDGRQSDALGSSGQTTEGGYRPALFSTTQESLVEDLRAILTPHYVTRAREFATRMTKPADLVENFAQLRRVG